MRTDSRGFAERLLQLVGRLVPGYLRREWLREWKAEFRSSRDRGHWFTLARLAGAIEDASRMRSRTLRRDSMITQDIKHALKHWRRQPAFAAVVVAILTVGLGANTAVFALVEATMIRPLPFQDGQDLVHFWQTRLESDSLSNFAHPTFVDIRERTQTLAGVAAYHSPSMTLTDGESTRTVESVRVTPNFFTLLGVEPVLGRNFRETDDQLAADRIVVLGDGFWRTEFGADPEIIGRTLILDGTPYSVVGVLPQDFVFPRERRAEVWRPMIPTEREATARGFRWMHVIGRLADDANAVQAQDEMDRIAADLALESPQENGGRGLRLISMRDQVIGDIGPAVTAVYGAVMLVLLITCANLAHLLLARVAGRRSEIAVRKALGATRWQLVRHVLVEVMLLFLIGGAAGAVFAGWLLDAVVAVMPAGALLQAPFLGDLSIHGGVLAYGLGLALLCGGLFGLIPALQIGASKSVGSSMATRGALPRAGSRLLVGSQVAVAVVLMASTLLLVRSTLELLEVDPGFDTENLLTLRISLPGAAYDDEARIVAFNRELVERVSGLPGVLGAAAIDRIPLTGNSAATYVGIPGAESEEDRVRANFHVITPEYFDVMGMQLIDGRALVAGDDAGSRPVVVVNELLAAALFGDRDPLGLDVLAGGERTLAVVGVVGDVKVQTIDAPEVPAMYIHTAQLPSTGTGLVVRTRDQPAALVNAVRAQVIAMDPALDIYEVSSMRGLIDSSPAMLTRTIPALLLSGFAAFATLLVALGLFAVVGHDVASRRREIGIRRALGALPSRVVRDVTSGTFAIVGVGVAAGVVAAIAAARLLESVLFGVGAADPIALVATAAVVLMVSMLACIVPARRAVRVDPTEALRSE